MNSVQGVELSLGSRPLSRYGPPGQVEEALELGKLSRRLGALKMLVHGTPATSNCL